MTSKLTKVITGTLCLGIMFGIGLCIHSDRASAVKATDFNAGNIIDDSVFYNKDAMTLTEIEQFIKDHTVSCDTWGTGAIGTGRYIHGVAVNPNTSRADYARQMIAAGFSRYHEPPYICLTNYYENPETHVTSFDTGAQKLDGMLSAAEIIYEASQKYGINPQVLLVMLKKEYSYVYTDNWPLRDQYNTVMGYACPDTGPNGTANCNSKYYGFYNQVMNAAWQLNYYKENIKQYNYQPYRTNTISYSVNASCGTKQVYIENIATASLYIYTPYVPNDAALAAYPGEANCGSYGNRNFFMFFNEWFGSTYFSAKKVDIIPGDFYLAYDESTTVRPSQTRASGNTLTIGMKNGNETDTFSIIKNSDGTYTLKNIATGLVVDVPSGSAYDGAILQQYASNDTNAQKWYLYKNRNGSYSIASVLNHTLVITLNANNVLALSPYEELEEQSFSLIAAQQAISDGEYIISTALSDNFVIDISGGGIERGTRAQIYGANGSAAQIFKFKYDERTGWYEITHVASGRVLDVKNGATTNGTGIQIYDANGSCAQRWQIIGDTENGYEILSACTGKSLDVENGAAYNYAKLQLYDRNGTAAQRWQLSELVGQDESGDGNLTDERQLVADGIYTISSALKENYVLDVYNGNTSNYTNIWMYGYNGSEAQKFEITYNKQTGYYTFRNPRSNRVVDVYGGNTISGTNVQIYDANGSCAQNWRINDLGNGQYEILSACSGKALDVSGGGLSAGTNVQIFEPNNTKAQAWSFTKVE